MVVNTKNTSLQDSIGLEGKTVVVIPIVGNRTRIIDTAQIDNEAIKIVFSFCIVISIIVHLCCTFR